MKNIGKRAKQRREQLGLSQEEVAAYCEVSQQALQQMESGDVARPRYLSDLADVLKTSVEWLKTGKEGDAGKAPAAQNPDFMGVLGDINRLSKADKKKLLAILEIDLDDDAQEKKQGLPAQKGA